MVDKGTPYNAGDTATFRIYVYNQGTVTAAANTIKVKDYIPSDMILVDAAWNAADSSYTFSNAIAAGSLDSVDIAPNFMGTSITNNAEIVEDGGDDADSTPGSEANGNAPDGNDNDTGLTDGSDDYDPATVSVQQGYDLALTKVLVDKGTPYNAGDTATFRIYVYNQGTVTAAANTIKVKDYIPSDMILADAAWNAADSSYTFSNAVAAGSLDSVDIALQIAPSYMGTSITNNAEIVEDGGDDADSTPGSEANGNAPDGNDNDIAATDGSDDYDPASVPVTQTFDLALNKVLVTTSSVAAGDTVTFKIYVTNEGSLDATNVIVKENLGASLILADADWAADSTYTFASLTAGQTDSIEVDVQIAPDFMGTSLENSAEIAGGTNALGEPDGDSTPNDGSTTEDDDAIAPVTVGQIFDLALNKVAPVGTFNLGDTITYTINVSNEGTLDATNVTIKENVPTGLILVDADWNLADSTYAIGNLAVGASVAIEVDLRIDPLFTGTSIDNVAEVSNADNALGMGDRDSNPAEGTTTPSEDDEDNANINVGQVYDLALTKVLVDKGSDYSAGDTATFRIYVYNQGTLPTAVNTIKVKDYIPSDMILADNAWNAADSSYTFPNAIAANSLDSVDIALQIAPSFMGTSITNNAEIVEDGGDDNDSTPGSEANGNASDGNDNDVAATDGSDDYDPAEVRVGQFFDLALIQTLAPGQASAVAPGETVDIKVKITNQGTINADFIEITQYLPAGATLNAANAMNWIALNDSTAQILLTVGNGRLPVGGLAPDSMVMLTLQVVLDPNSPANEFVFHAEISEDGINNDHDSTPDDNRTNDDGGEVNTATDDMVNQAPPVDEDDEDPTMVTVEFFDLALTNELVTTGDVMPGDSITTKIKIFNQGDIPADSIRVYAYIPEGLELDDPNWIVLNDSVAYTVLTVADGELPTGGLLADSMTMVTLGFNIEPSFMGSILLVDAEIGSATDENGNPVTDLDSTPDGTNDDIVGADNVTDGTNNDEDDHDPAFVNVTQVFDLALIETLAPGQANVVRPGETVDIKVKVTNQGTLNADTIELTQYLPAGVTLNAANAMGWTALNDSTVQILLTVGNGLLPAGGLAPDSMVMLTLQVVLDANVTAEEFVFHAEISDDGVNNDDIDSTPDNDRTNDAGGDVNTATDDIVDQTPPTDEDDEDPTIVTVEYFDLALTTEILTASPISVVDSVTAKIKITNQGDIPADSIRVYAYLPTGLIVNDPNWIIVNDSVAYTVLTVADGELPNGGLLADSMAMVTIGLEINTAFTGTSLVLVAEIGSATDNNGNPVTDQDSTPDGMNDDIIGGDNVTDNSSNDEDDHDPATITLGHVFDLALKKTLAAGQNTVVSPGDTVQYLITVYNQGTLTAQGVQLVDYLTPDLEFINIPAINPNWFQFGGSNPGYIINTPIAAGDSIAVPVSFRVNPSFTGMSLTNTAEIAAADNDGNAGTTPPTDNDSNPDSLPGDDFGGNDIIDNTNNDEDDHDSEPITVRQPFDLALTKVLVDKGSAYQINDTVIFRIYIHNQGMIDATSVTVKDIIPSGLILADANWNADSTYTFGNGLVAGAIDSIDIALQIEPTFSGTSITNNAEISAATNALNQDDEDSTPNSEDGNSAADGNDNDLAATDGSDDYDPATVVVEQIFDLALIETLAPGQANVVRPGETVDIKVKVTNQGTLNAPFIELTQYLPAGVTLNMANPMGWMAINDSTAMIQLTAGNGLPVGGLAPDSMVMLILQVVLDENVTAQEFVFHAEISEDGANNDIDSTPDDDRTNDAGGVVNTATDDVVDQTPPTDEDDEDPTMVMVEYFDLALTTEITTTGAIMSGDSLTAKIKVFNQGEIPADSIRVYAYTSDSLIVNDPNWVVVNDSVAYTLLTVADGELPVGGLLPDSMTMVTIGLMIDPAFTGTDLMIVGEVGSATDEDGRPVRDVDSNPDSDNTDVIGGDNTTDGSNGDEDDHDPASVIVGQVFDLALTKVLVGNNTYLPGDTATFRIYIYNQGAIAATSVTVKDIIPGDLILADPNWTSNEYTFAGGLAIGATDSVDIDLQIASNFMGTSITNNAEISAATNAANQDDEDSTPNTEDGNSAPDGNDNDLAATDGSDDYDPATITVGQIFDLALIETLAPGQANVVRPGETVDIKVKVSNQGTLNADTIQLTQYLPAGVTLNTANAMGWTALNDSTAQILLTVGNGLLPAGGLAPDSMVMLTLQVVLDANVTADEFVFHAEISNDGQNNDIDSTPDAVRTNDAGGEVNTATDDIVDQTPPTDEDDEDPTMVTVEYFDLALTNELVTTGNVAPGDNVTTKVKVTNQGDIPADSIRIYAYIPEGLTLNDPNWVVVNDSLAYTLLTVADGDLPTGGVEADSMVMITLDLTIDPTFMGTDLVVTTEIGGATDQNGNPVTDQDSTPDAANTDTVGGDNVTDNSNNDEDDHDPATITVEQIFDLALIEDLAPGQSANVVPGDTADVKITVFNQGTLNADNITITQSLPAGVSLNAANLLGWTILNDSTVQITLTPGNGLPAGGLQPDSMVMVMLQIAIDENVRVDDLTLYAEISDDGANTDDDSTPNNDLTDDLGGVPNSATDNVTDGSNNDEDDHDPVLFNVELHDLALTKGLAAGQATTVRPGDTVAYTIWVYNQGNVNASNINVNDYPGTGLTFDAAINTGWGLVNGDLRSTIIGPLAAGDSLALNINFIVESTFTGTAIDNIAEIQSFNEVGSVEGPKDLDSTPANTNGSEDDQDNVPVIVIPNDFDLALTIATAPGQATAINAGDEVETKVTIFNQGNVTADFIEITANIPTGMSLSTANANGWTQINDSTVVITLTAADLPNGGIVDGEMHMIPLFLAVDAGFMGTDLTVRAEISDDGAGNVDADSTPDSDFNNDIVGGDNITNNTGNDEDDHDPVSFTLTQTFDLALTKKLADGQLSGVLPGEVVEYTITVYNQGSLDAYDVDVVDYIPTDMSLVAIQGWTGLTATTAGQTIPFIAARDSASLNIFLQLAPTFAGTNITNNAEIAEAAMSAGGPAAADEDSTPDNIFGNDGTQINNATNDPADQDDADYETIEVGTFDLALDKRLASTQSETVSIGDDIDYEICITNEGNVDAYNISVVDRIPNGLALSTNDNNSWLTQSATSVYKVIAGPVTPGQTVCLNIKLTLVNGNPGADFENVAEIFDQQDAQGNSIKDIDSTPDLVEENEEFEEDDNGSAIVNLFVCPDQVVASNLENICQGESVQLGVTTLTTLPVTYSWTPASGLDDPFSATPVASPFVSTTYIVATTVAAEACVIYDTIRVNVFDVPNPDFHANVACVGEPTIFDDETVTYTTLTGWFWDFGDGVGTSTEQNPSYTYENAGHYLVKLITESTNGCRDSAWQEITVNPGAQAGAKGRRDTICIGECVELLAQGGTSFAWSPAATLNHTDCYNPIACPTETTTYYVDVTNDFGCTSRDSVTITVIPGPTVAVDMTDISECGVFDGTITVNATGLASNYQYSIDGGLTYSSSNAFTNLPAASYLVVVKGGGCEVPYPNNPVIIGGPQSPRITAVPAVNPSCTADDGSITIEADGASNLVYSVNGGITWVPENVFTNLGGGTYYIAVASADLSCITYYPPVTLVKPAAPVFTDVRSTNPSDCGVNDGTISIIAAGADAIEYGLSNGLMTVWQSSNNFINLPAGTYDVYVRNAGNTCETAYPLNSIVLAEPVVPSLTAVQVVQPTDCGVDNALITILSTPGSAPLEYSIDGGINWNNFAFYENLQPGTYNVFVRNQGGTCAVAYSNNPINISYPEAATIVEVIHDQPQDCTTPDGRIEITAEGGAADLIYSIDAGATWQESSVFIGLSGGIYNVRVANSDESCVAIYPTIELFDAIGGTIDGVTVDGGCGDGTGTISIAATSNVPLEYSVDNGATYQSSNNFFNLPNGNYNILIRNVNDNCATAYANNPVNINRTFTGIDNVLTSDPIECGSNDGSISVNATGANLVYSIDGGINFQTSADFDDLPTGIYNIFIQDLVTGCDEAYIFNPLELVGPPQPEIRDIEVTASTDCDANDAVITIAAEGTGNLQYSLDGSTWSNGNTFINLLPGLYNVHVRNGDESCSAAYKNNPILITAPEGPAIVDCVPTNPTDCNVNDGTLTVIATGGQGNLQYSIDGGTTWQASNIFTDLAAGIYSVAVANEDETCKAIHPLCELVAPELPVLNEVAAVNPSICGEDNGSITILADGNGGLEYSIDGGNNWSGNSFFGNLAAGEYEVAVRNATDNCIVNNGIVTLDAPAAPTVVAGMANESTCTGNSLPVSITISENIAQYTILGSGGYLDANVSGATLTFDAYLNGVVNNFTVTLENADGCSVVEEFAIFQAADPEADFIVHNPTCAASDVTIEFTGEASPGAVLTWDVGSATIVSSSPATATAPAGATLVVQWAIAGGKTISLDLNDGGCEDRKVQNVNVNKLPFADAGADVTICDGECVQLNGLGNGAQYQWSPAIGLSATDIPNPMACPPVTTTYQLLVMGSEGCMVMDEVTVTVAGALTANAGPDQSMCEGESIQLEATGGVSYKWTPSTGLSNPNIANPVATPQTITTYTVEVTNATGCIGRDAMVVTVTPKPTVDAGDEQMICVGENTMLSATGAISYEWSPATGLSSTNVPTPIASPTETTTYTVTGTDVNGCTATDEVTVIVGGNAQANAGTDVEVCLGSATQLNASGGVIYSWSPTTGLDNPNVANPMASPNSTTTYTVTVTNLDGCIGTDQVTVTVNGFIAANAGADQTVCSGEEAFLNATGGISYVWSPATGLNNPNIANPVATLTTTTTYTVTATNAEGCTATDEVTIAVSNNAVAEAGADQTICNGSAALLNATGGVSYVWSPSTGLSNPNIANPVATPNVTMAYMVSVTTADGCTATDQVMVMVRENPIVNAGADQTICNGSAALLNATGGVNYTWSPVTGLNNANIANPVASPTTTTTYTVSVTTADGCTATDQVTVTVGNNPIVNAGADQTICNGAAALLNATGGVNYTWSPAAGLNNANIANPVASPNTTTTYTVSVTTAEGCTGTDQVTVTVGNNPIVNAGADQTICSGTTAFLNATGGVNYVWSPATGLSNANTANPVATPTTTTTYTVSVTTADGCTATDQVTVTVDGACDSDGDGYTDEQEAQLGSNPNDPCDPDGAIANAGADQTICNGSTAFLNATGGVTYSWSPTFGLSNPNIANPVVTPIATTTYTVTVRDAKNCVATDQVTVTVGNGASFVNAGTDQTVCSGSTTFLNATGGVNYVWSPATGLSNPTASNPTATVNQTTTYTVTSTNAQGCTSTDQITIFVNDNINVGITPNVSTCGSQPVALNATGGTTYSWSPAIGLSNPNIANPIANPTTTTTYCVTVTNAQGCLGTACTTVSVNPGPTVVGCPDKYICNGGSVRLTVNGGVSWVWSPATGLDNPFSPAPNASPSVTTTYTVTGTDAFGCSSSDLVVVTVNGSATVNAGQDQTTCAGGTVQLAASGGVTYNWSPSFGLSNPNIANPIVTPSTTTTYTVQATTADGCVGTDQVTVFVNNGAQVNAGPDQTTCVGSSTTLNATGGSNYTWSPATGLSNPNIANPIANPAVTTTYTVTSTSGGNCTSSDQVTVFVTQPAEVVGCEDKTICPGGSIQLTVTTGASYLYSPATGLSDPTSPTPIATPTQTTTYTVFVTDANGCVGSDEIVVFVSGDASANAGSDQTVCAGGTAQLAASGGTSYNWSPTFGLSNPNIANPTVSPIATTTYTVTVRTAGGCTDTDQVTVAVSDEVTANAGIDQSICAGESAFLNASGGTTYSWSPATGLSNPDIANPVASPATTTIYNVTTTNANGCVGNDQVTVTVLSAPTVNPSILNPGCCNDNGSINLAVFGGSGDYTYAWSPNVSASSTANNLPAGNYKIVITDRMGCDVISNVNLTQDCNNCIPISPEREVCVAQNATVGEICLPVRQEDIGQYLITAAGQTINPNHGCNFENLTAYSYSLLQGAGNSGPYKVDSWTVNGAIYTTMVNNMSELANWMNSVDPSGNWTQNASVLVVSGGKSSIDLWRHEDCTPSYLG